MTTFKLVHSKNYFQTKKSRVFAMMVLGICFVLVGKRYGSGLIDLLGLQDELGSYVIVILTISGIYLMLSYWYSRITKHLGTVSLTADKLLIRSSEVSLDVRFEEMEFLMIVHNSYVGEDFKESPFNNYIGDNWIEFRTGGNDYKFEFKVDSVFKKNQLERLVEDLQKSHSNIQYQQK